MGELRLGLYHSVTCPLLYDTKLTKNDLVTAIINAKFCEDGMSEWMDGCLSLLHGKNY